MPINEKIKEVTKAILVNKIKADSRILVVNMAVGTRKTMDRCDVIIEELKTKCSLKSADKEVLRFYENILAGHRRKSIQLRKDLIDSNIRRAIERQKLQQLNTTEPTENS